MGIRRQARECALQILYQLDGIPAPDPQRVEESVNRFFENFEAPDRARTLALEIVRGVVKVRDELDGVIQRHSPRWRLERMAIVDRNVLRIGAFELMHQTDVPPRVALDESIEIAKRFGTDTSAAFVNGVLDAIARAQSTPPAEAKR